MSIRNPIRNLTRTAIASTSRPPPPSSFASSHILARRSGPSSSPLLPVHYSQRRTYVATSPPVAAPTESPSHASIDETVEQDYEPVEEYDPNDPGHSTVGGRRRVGRHTRRTLASFSMTNKVCVVTGAARGLGNLFARTFVESGSNAVAILDLDQTAAEDAAKDMTSWFNEHGQTKPGEVNAIGYGCDVSNEDAVKSVMDDIIKKFGRIDVLVTAAGICSNYKALDYPTDKYRQLMAINIDGSFFPAREAARHMIAQNRPGSIVLVGSMSGSVINVPQPQTPYNASKSAIKHMAASLAVEWARNGIRVNCLSPGYMATSLTRAILDKNPALRETWENLTPVGRIGEPEDLKGAVVYLSSDASAFTTGTDLIVDGGYVLT